MKPVQKAPFAGVMVGASMLAFAPTLGGIATVALLLRAFKDVDAHPPAEKARILAEGISESMNCTAAGIGLGLFGFVCASVCLWLYVRLGRDAPASGT